MSGTIHSNGAIRRASEQETQTTEHLHHEGLEQHDEPRSKTSMDIHDLFATGNLAGTHGAVMALLEETVARHRHGDWGDLDESDKQQNLLAIVYGKYILSSYILPHTRVRIWVVTEGDRSMTMVMLPDEYQNPHPWGPPTQGQSEP